MEISTHTHTHNHTHHTHTIIHTHTHNHTHSKTHTHTHTLLYLTTNWHNLNNIDLSLFPPPLLCSDSNTSLSKLPLERESKREDVVLLNVPVRDIFSEFFFLRICSFVTDVSLRIFFTIFFYGFVAENVYVFVQIAFATLGRCGLLRYFSIIWNTNKKSR